MAAGAEKRLDDYFFLRNTYETVSGQEAQLNRILRMLDEDEINLSWRIDTTPLSRVRSRSLYDFERGGESLVLPGSIAYERLRDMEKDLYKHRPISRAKSNVDDEEKRRAEARRKQNDMNSFDVRKKTSESFICQWTSPRWTSEIDFFQVERQIDGNDWENLGEKLDRTTDHLELKIESIVNDQPNRSRFRLKAKLNDGKTLFSDPTDEILLEPIENQQGFIYPDVKILSVDSAELSWKNQKPKGNVEPSNFYDLEKRDGPNGTWQKIRSVAFSHGSTQVDSLIDIDKCQFRLVPSSSDLDLLTVHNVNEWLSSLKLVPTKANQVEIEISEEGFRYFDRYKVEFTTIDRLDQWEQMSNITHETPHLTIENLHPGEDYKFRFTPILRASKNSNDVNASQLALVLDVKMPSTRKPKMAKIAIPPPQFAIHQVDPTRVFIEAILSKDQLERFDQIYDVYSKTDTENDQWTKIGTIDKEHLNLNIENLQENTAYTFKFDNRLSPSMDNQNNVVQEFQFQTASVKQYDPSLFLEKVEQSLENVVNNVMRAAAGHQALEDPVNISLNDVIKEIFHDDNLVPNEQYGFDTLALSSDLQLFRGPKQMMLQELEGNETIDTSKSYGEIIIHNYRRTGEKERQPVIVRDDNGNTRIGNIDGDVIVRNVVTDVLLTNEETRNQLAMNIVGQAFLKSVQGVLLASNFKGIIVVKTVNKP